MNHDRLDELQMVREHVIQIFKGEVASTGKDVVLSDEFLRGVKEGVALACKNAIYFVEIRMERNGATIRREPKEPLVNLLDKAATDAAT